jgi:2-polyprenyl-3-methyl-5-hydroxy-6-metoxy-1,4-benzoquinol methylase
MGASQGPPAEGPRYDAVASWYDQWVAVPEDDPVARSLLRLIGPVRDEQVLDLGCGQGRIARTLAGASNEVVGVDLSAELLAIARSRASEQITYLHADVTTTDWWDGHPFDGVVSSMALMDIDDLDGAVATAAATVRPGGWFAWSIIHPAFPGLDEIRPSWPTDGGYFDERWWNTGGDGVRGRVGSNHRTLSTYLNALTAAGFALDAADEPPWWPTTEGRPMPFFLVTRWHRT